MTDAADDRHETRRADPPDQSDVRPIDRRIGEGVRTDGPNGQSSTPQQPADSVIELGPGERPSALPKDEGEAR